jgi:hypothetical protein
MLPLSIVNSIAVLRPQMYNCLIQDLQYVQFTVTVARLTTVVTVLKYSSTYRYYMSFILYCICVIVHIIASTVYHTTYYYIIDHSTVLCMITLFAFTTAYCIFFFRLTSPRLRLLHSKQILRIFSIHMII